MLLINKHSDDIRPLENECKARGIIYKKYRHEMAMPLIKDVVGFYPIGKWHILINDVSIIKGYSSGGCYEALGGRYKEPRRFSSAKELLDDLGNRAHSK